MPVPCCAGWLFFRGRTCLVLSLSVCPSACLHKVWEESVINCPKTCLMVALSATMSNVGEIKDWVHHTHGPSSLVVSDFRPVPLS